MFGSCRVARSVVVTLPLVLTSFFLFSVTPTDAVTLTWTGTDPGLKWSTAANWQPTAVPGANDIVVFDQAGSAGFPGDVTSLIAADHTVDAVRYRGNGHYHTTDLQSHTLHVARSLDVNFDRMANTIATIKNGTLQLGTAVSPGDLIIARRISSGEKFTAKLDLSRLSSFESNLNELSLGAASSGVSVGMLDLAVRNTITAGSILLGRAADSTVATGINTLRLGQENVIVARELLVGDRFASGQLEGPPGGNVQLGTAETPTNLVVGRLNATTASNSAGVVDLSGMTVNAFLGNLTVSDRSQGGIGKLSGRLTAGNSGDIQIGAVDALGNVVIGRATEGGVSSGDVNLSGLNLLTANLNQLLVGAATADATADGVLRLARNNVITAQQVVVGDGQQASGRLHLGHSNELIATDLLIGLDGRDEPSQVTVAGRGQLVLGSQLQPTNLVVAHGSLMLTAAEFSGHLSSLSVADNSVNGPTLIGSVQGALRGSLQIGSPSQPGNIVVARGRSQGTLDLSGLDALSAQLHDFLVGVASTNVPVAGDVQLPVASTIEATRIVVGQGGDDNNSTLRLGATSTLIADEILVGIDESEGGVEAVGGAAITIGSPDRRARLVVGRGDTDTNDNFGGKVDLSGTELTAWLSELVVGQKNDLSGVHRGELLGGNAGQLTIGGPESRGNIAIGVSRAVGNVDLASMDRLEAYVDQVWIGVTNGRRAEGDFLLPSTSLIDAHSIVIGSDPSVPTSHSHDGNTEGSLTLGMDTTILADEIVVGRDYGSGIVRAPGGSALQLGSPERRLNLQLGTGVTNTNDTYFGNVDLSGAAVSAWLGNVVLGDKNRQPGQQQAELIFSNSADNAIDAESIVIGGNQSLGHLRFAGGKLRADSISRGTGEAVFDWTGGTLEVGSFGSMTQPFDLHNPGGVLAPGASIGETNLFGNYTQGEDATLMLEIGGSDLALQHDRLVVDGRALLGGRLQVDPLEDGAFDPMAGQSFDLLTASEGIEGVFADLQLPDLPYYLAWELNHVGNALMLEIVEGPLQLPGDYNGDGAIDVADYTRWRDHLGAPPGTLPNDIDGGVIGAEQYATWKANFGMRLAETGSLQNAAIPEPSTVLLLWGLAVGRGLLRRPTRMILD